MVQVLVGVIGCVPRPTGHSLVTLFSLSMSVKDRLLLWIQSGHRLIILSTYLLMRAGRLVALLSWVPALSRLTNLRRGWCRSKHHTESGTQEWGHRVQV